jgi:hypothetical protein
LTIKLTRHVVTVPLVLDGTSHPDKFAFPQLLYSSRTCGLHAAHITANRAVSPVRGARAATMFARRALPADSVVKELRSRPSAWKGGTPHSRRGVQKSRTEIKTRRRAPGQFVTHGRIRAMLGSMLSRIRDQPHSQPGERPNR